MELLLPVFGFFVGAFASLTGVGGGVIIFPILTLLYKFSPQQAVATSLGMILFTALSSTWSYSRQKRIYFRTGLLMAVTTVPGAWIGAWMTTVITPRALGLIFGVFLAIVAGRLIGPSIRGRKSKGSHAGPEPPAMTDRDLVRSGRPMIQTVALSLGAGMSSGLLGIGGGVFAVPIMTFILKMPIHYATATSMFTMIFTSMSGVLKHHLAHHLHWGFVVLLGLGAVFGAPVGALVSKRLSGRNLRLIFGLVLLMVSVQILADYF